MKRTFKQIIYGSLFLIILFGLFMILSVKFTPPMTCFDGIQNQGEEGVDCGSPCLKCELKGLEMILNEILFFPASDRRINLSAQITNPSVNYGARFNYVVYIYNRFGLRVDIVEADSYILPSANKYLLVPALDVNYRDISEVDFKINKIDWIIGKDLLLPDLTVEDVKISIDDRYIEVDGIVHHQSAGIVRRLLVGALFFDERGELIHFSTTRLNNIPAFSSRNFEIFLPLQHIKEKNFDRRLTKITLEIIP